MNLDGKYDTGDILLAGRTVFIDKNDNGKLDSGETSVLTNSSGNYSNFNLAAGTYRVADVVPSGYRLTSASARAISNVDLKPPHNRYQQREILRPDHHGAAFRNALQ